MELIRLEMILHYSTLSRRQSGLDVGLGEVPGSEPSGGARNAEVGTRPFGLIRPESRDGAGAHA